MVILFIPVILAASLQLSYQYIPPSRELNLCLNKPTTSHTLKSFWQDVSRDDCELDAISLVEQYVKLGQSGQSIYDDNCNMLLIHQMRKKLINAASQQLEEAIIIHTLEGAQAVKRLLDGINILDPHIVEMVWERTIDEIFSFIEIEALIEAIQHLHSGDQQVFALGLLLNKIKMTSWNNNNNNALPLFTNTLVNLMKINSDPNTSMHNLNTLFYRLPQELRTLYASTNKKPIGLLNLAYSEYLYAPRDNGPDNDHRLPLTWSKEKNATDSDGQLFVETNTKAYITIGSRFAASTKYLYADIEKQAPFFWIGSGTKSNQWWQIIWSHDSSNCKSNEMGIVLQNVETKEILCAGSEYDENRRYVVLMKGEANTELRECQWLVREMK